MKKVIWVCLLVLFPFQAFSAETGYGDGSCEYDESGSSQSYDEGFSEDLFFLQDRKVVGDRESCADVRRKCVNKCNSCRNARSYNVCAGICWAAYFICVYGE